MMAKIIPAHLAGSDAFYKRLGIVPGPPALHEDGLRTDGSKGTYEWWYFDSKLVGGGSLVIVFYTKPMMSTASSFAPYATVEYITPEGKEYFYRRSFEGTADCFSKEQCDVRLGECYFRGDLHEYEIYFKSEQIEVQVALTGNTPAWRTKTGHIFFGEQDFFAWIPAVPEGNVKATIQLEGQTLYCTGSGYHDHNWGNSLMPKLMHHWYWGRAQIGEYVVISSYITANEKYGFEEFPVFMLAKNGTIIADEPDKYLTYSEREPYFDEVTGKHVYARLVYDYNDGEQHYRITYRRQRDLARSRFIDQMKGFKKWALQLIGFCSTYHRMAGEATIERLENGVVVETATNPAIWELMYFGKDKI